MLVQLLSEARPTDLPVSSHTYSHVTVVWALRLAAARDLILSFQEATTSGLARDILERALAAAESDDCYQALKLARRIMRHEDAVLGREAPPPMPTPTLAPRAAA